LTAAWRWLTATSSTATRSPRAAWLRSAVLPLCLSLLCLRSVFHDGYLLQVDIGFGPRPAPIGTGLSAPVSALQAAAVHVFGGDVAGKVYAVGALFLAGFGPMALFRRAPWYAQCAAGFLGALNPWVYDRMVEGQWGIVVAASGLFLWLAAWEALQARPGLGRAALVAACGAAITAFDPHSLGLVALLTLVGALWKHVWRDRARLWWSAAAAGLLGLLLLPGAVTFFLARSPGSYLSVREFTRADFEFFRSSSSSRYGLIANLLGLYGYWGERIGRFPLATGGASWWPITTTMIVATAALGAWLRRERAWLLLCGLIGVGVSASTALPGGADAASRLASRIPLVGAYREPQKWNALWLLALVVLSAGAIEALGRRPTAQRPHGRSLAPALAYLLAVAALVPAGVSQARALPSIVTPVRYPHYWYETAAYLARVVPRRDRIVVLPWHLYQPLRVSEGRLIANPAGVFFSGRLITPHNVEIPGRSTEIISRYDRIGLVSRGATGCRLARVLRNEGIRWAVVLDGAESAQTVLRLRRCGYSLEEGRPGFTAILQRKTP
jgi:hypothetical protein